MAKQHYIGDRNALSGWSEASELPPGTAPGRKGPAIALPYFNQPPASMIGDHLPVPNHPPAIKPGRKVRPEIHLLAGETKAGSPETGGAAPEENP